MNAPVQKARAKALILTSGDEKILRAIYCYRYITALDVAHLLYSPSSLTYVRSLLSTLAGGADLQTRSYLSRFQLPTVKTGNRENIFCLGVKGRDFLATVIGQPAEWYFRPYKLKHFSYSHVRHNLILTRFVVAAHAWSRKQKDFRLVQTRLCYELAKTPATVDVTKETGAFKVIPDAWLLFERLKSGEHDAWFPVLLEIDRGMEYQQKFKQHVRSRIEFIKKGGAYSKLFETEAVTIAYATTGDTAAYRETRRRAMCAWTNEVLAALGKASWASLFRFHSLCLEDIYNSHIFEAAVWYRPDSPSPVPLFTSIAREEQEKVYGQ